MPLQSATSPAVVPPDHQLPAHTQANRTGIRDLARAYTEVAGQALDVARQSVVCAWTRARTGTMTGYTRGSRAAQHLATETRDRAVSMRQDHPVQLLGIIAGAAFVAGIATRIWRSRSV